MIVNIKKYIKKNVFTFLSLKTLILNIIFFTASCAASCTAKGINIEETKEPDQQNILGTTGGFNHLSPELIFEIAKRVPVKDYHGTLRRLSKKFYTLLSSPYALLETNSSFFIKNEADFSIFIEKYGSHIQKGVPVRLEEDWVTDAILSKLSGAQNVNLSGCTPFTDKGLKYLKNARVLDLSSCYRLTDSYLVHLENVENLNLSHCKKITDKGLKYLKNARVLDLSSCYQLTDSYLVHLENVENLNLSHCKKITDEGLRYIQNVKTLDLSWCEEITDKGLENIKNVRDIKLFACTKISDEGLKHLAHAQNLDLSLTKITGKGLDYLLLAKIVRLYVCHEIPDAAKIMLRCRGIEVLEK